MGSVDNDRPFNATIATLERVDKRFDSANQAKEDGNLIRYHRALENVWMTIKPRIKEETERTSARGMIDKAKNMIRTMPGVGGGASHVLSDAEDHIDNAYEYINDLAFKYKINWWEAEVLPYEEEVRKDFA